MGRRRGGELAGPAQVAASVPPTGPQQIGGGLLVMVQDHGLTAAQEVEIGRRGGLAQRRRQAGGDSLRHRLAVEGASEQVADFGGRPTLHRRK